MCGRQYAWTGHGFPEDDDRAVALMHQSVEQGSALGGAGSDTLRRADTRTGS